MTLWDQNLRKRKEYAKYRSLLSLDFTSIQGAYDQANNPGAYIGTNHQDDILECVVDTFFLSYPTKEATEELFKRAAELVPAIPKTSLTWPMEKP